MRSGTLAGCVNQYPDLDLNQGLDLRRVQCKSATPSGQTEPTTGFAPASAANQINTAKTGAFFGRATSANQHEREESNPVEQFWRLPALPGAHSCKAAHRTMGSQGIRRESNPYLLVHSQACSDRYTTDTISSRQQLDQDLNPELCVRTAA